LAGLLNEVTDEWKYLVEVVAIEGTNNHIWGDLDLGIYLQTPVSYSISVLHQYSVDVSTYTVNTKHWYTSKAMLGKYLYCLFLKSNVFGWWSFMTKVSLSVVNYKHKGTV